MQFSLVFFFASGGDREKLTPPKKQNQVFCFHRVNIRPYIFLVRGLDSGKKLSFPVSTAQNLGCQISCYKKYICVLEGVGWRG